ncbi:MAG: toll/interleukin-1 receptor domain-containing protein [Leptospirales bacterium]
MKVSWKESNWDTLLMNIQEGNCILMLGPETPIETDEKKHAFIGEQLNKRLLEDLEKPVKDKNWASENFSVHAIAQYYLLKAETGKSELAVKVKQFFSEHKDDTTKFHQNLATLPFSLVLQTTPDFSYINALKALNKEPAIESYNYKGQAQQTIPLGTIDNPLVYYLFGSTKEIKSLVITENDMMDFFIAIASKDPPLPGNIINELRDQEKTLLFLGFGLHTWYLRILLHILKLNNKESLSYAFESISNDKIDQLESVALFYRKSGYKIEMFDNSITDFAQELAERYKKIAPQSSDEKKKITSTGPSVFLCHAGEDKPFAEDLFNRLGKAGFDPWLDKEALRGGDQWDSVIKKNLDTVDYVIVLQSKNIHDKVVGYVNKEINLSLERQLEYRPPIRFIVPVQIDNSPPLEPLEHLQSINLSSGDNFDALIQTLQRDQQRRKKAG